MHMWLLSDAFYGTHRNIRGCAKLYHKYVSTTSRAGERGRQDDSAGKQEPLLQISCVLHRCVRMLTL